MGYRFVLRKLTYPGRVQPHGVLPFTTWWENKGVAPCYRELQLGIVDRQTREPRVRLAIEGRNDEGWYPMSAISVEDGPYPVGIERDLDTP